MSDRVCTDASLEPMSLMSFQRQRLGLSQKQLAEMTGLSNGTICDVERGLRRNIGLSNASKIAAVLGLPTSTLLDDLRASSLEIILEPEAAL